MMEGPGLVVGHIVFPLAQVTTVIGRTDRAKAIHPEIDISPFGGGLVVSRRHAEVTRRDDGFFLRDLGSRSGTLVNGDLLGDSERELKEGDAVTIGTVTLRFSRSCSWPGGLVAEWDEMDASGTTSTQLPHGLPLVAQLPNALKAQEVVLHYQPQVSLTTGEVEGVEALIRWDHPKMGAIEPERYLDLAEDSGFVRVLTTFALREAAAAASYWRQSPSSVAVGVNVSILDLEDPGFVDRASETVAGGNASPRDFVLEVTENAVMHNPGIAIASLDRLKEAGFSISIDDFGTGRSSLAYLKDLPADEVKLDRSFSIALGERDKGIVESAVQMAHGLGMSVVAEGVETDESLRFLVSVDCDRAQGYLFGRAVPKEEVDTSRRVLPPR